MEVGKLTAVYDPHGRERLELHCEVIAAAKVWLRDGGVASDHLLADKVDALLAFEEKHDREIAPDEMY